MLERLLAGSFAAAFFAALPFWFLSTQEGEVRFSGGGSPWRCQVKRSWLWQSSEESFEPTRITSREGTVSYKGRHSAAWQLVFEVNGAKVDVLAGGLTTDREVVPLAEQLERARAAHAPVEIVLPASGIYWLSVALTVLFAAAGFLMITAGGRPTPPK